MYPQLFHFSDFIWVPICFFLLYGIFNWVSRDYPKEIKRIVKKAFFFKIITSFFFTILIGTYYHGDSEMYYQGVLDVHKFLNDNKFNLWEVLSAQNIPEGRSLANYFYFDNSAYPLFYAMMATANYFVVKIAILPALIFQDSYIAICFCFAFFAFGGAVRLFKFFYYYFPNRLYEVALATLFIPSAVFWSSGLLKDSLCFGAMGYLLYGIFSMIERKKDYFTSALWILASIYLLFNIKIYILLAIAPGITIWLFLKTTGIVQDRTLKRLLGTMLLVVSSLVGIVLIRYITSSEAGKSFQLDRIVESSNAQKAQYSQMATYDQGAYFSAGGGNPITSFLGGIVASLYRPFPWEISSPMVVLGAIESFIFLVLTFLAIKGAGIKRFFEEIFGNTQLMICFFFAIIFAGAVGSTALNFGSLSRYKIPCMPFYLLMILIVMRQANVPYPRWLNKVFKFVFR